MTVDPKDLEEAESTPQKAKAVKRRFAIEWRGISGGADWTVFKRYETKRAREQAFDRIQKGHSIWSILSKPEFRIAVDPE